MTLDELPDADNRYWLTNPETIKYLFEWEYAVIHVDQFPLSEDVISEMGEYFEGVNALIERAGVQYHAHECNGITQPELASLKDYIASHNTQAQMKQLSVDTELSRPQLVWLYLYIECRNPTPFPEQLVGPPTREESEAERRANKTKEDWAMIMRMARDSGLDE